jgi:hypothetical protein
VGVSLLATTLHSEIVLIQSTVESHSDHREKIFFFALRKSMQTSISDGVAFNPDVGHF